MIYITYIDNVNKTEAMRFHTGDSISEVIRLFKDYITDENYIVTTICSDGTFIAWDDLKVVLSREEKLKLRNTVRLKEIK